MSRHHSSLYVTGLLTHIHVSSPLDREGIRVTLKHVRDSVSRVTGTPLTWVPEPWVVREVTEGEGSSEGEGSAKRHSGLKTLETASRTGGGRQWEEGQTKGKERTEEEGGGGTTDGRVGE